MYELDAGLGELGEFFVLQISGRQCESNVMFFFSKSTAILYPEIDYLSMSA